MVTDRDIEVLLALDRYYVLNREQVQRLVFPNDPNGRITRKRLQLLVDAHLINRQSLLFCHPSAGAAAPVYYPASKGCQLLAEHFEEERFLSTPTLSPIQHHVPHWLAVSETHIAFDQAVARQDRVQINAWLNEWDAVNKHEIAPEKRYRIYTLIRERPRLICAPDAAFLLSLRGHKKVFYLEQDRATSGVHQIANSKTQGYAAMAEQELHRRHFPETTLGTFTVVMVAPTTKRRDALRHALRDKPAAHLWRFTAADALAPENVLHAPIWYACDDEPPKPLVKEQE